MAPITLNAAVTRLIGSERSPLQEVGRPVFAQNELRRLATDVALELQGSPEGSAQLSKLGPTEWDRERGPVPPPTYWPPSTVLQTLESLGAPTPLWSPTLLAFRDAAANWEREFEIYDAAYAQELNQLLEAGRIGVVRFFGRWENSRRAKVSAIPREHFLNVLTIDGDRQHLIASGRIRGAPPLYQNAHPPRSPRDQIDTVFYVEIESDDLVRLQEVGRARIEAVGQYDELLDRQTRDQAAKPGSDALERSVASTGKSTQSKGATEAEIADWLKANRSAFDLPYKSDNERKQAMAVALRKAYPRTKDARLRIAAVIKGCPELRRPRGRRPKLGN